MVLSHFRFGSFQESRNFPWICVTTAILYDVEEEEDMHIEQLWTLDSLGINEDHQPTADSGLEDRILDKFYTTSQFINGFLYVRFPWKDSHPKMQDNKQLAYSRLDSQ